jgi:glycine/D-amino acid oxidase-like deaminating enzyme
MADLVVAGAGVVGLGTAMLLADDRHMVTVVERDTSPQPESAAKAWGAWDRRGSNQFRLPHFFLARYRLILDAELPLPVDFRLEDVWAPPRVGRPDEFSAMMREGERSLRAGAANPTQLAADDIRSAR